MPGKLSSLGLLRGPQGLPGSTGPTGPTGPAGGDPPDATDSVKGVLRLTNSLGGTADAPQVVNVDGVAGVALVKSATLGFTAGLAPLIRGNDYTVNGGTAPTMTVQAPNATGTGATTGGPLDIRGGTGATPGGVTLRYGSTLRLTVGETGVVVAGDHSVGTQAAKVFSESYGAFGATHSGVWLGVVTPALDNVALVGDGTSTIVNALTRVQMAEDGTINATFTSDGLRIGDTSDPTERLEVVGNMRTSGGWIRASRNNSASTLAVADACLNLETPSGGQGLLVFSFAGSPAGGIRADNVGNFNWHSSSGGYHQFYRGLDTSTPVANLTDAGLAIGFGAGTAATKKLDVNGVGRFVTANTNLPLAAGNAAVLIDNTNGGAGTSELVFAFAGAAQAGFRAGFEASLYYYAGGSQYHQFLGALDNSVALASIANTGILVGGALGAVAAEKIDAVGNIRASGFIRASHAGSQAEIGPLVGGSGGEGALYLGVASPSATNSVLYSNGTTTVRLSIPGAGDLDFYRNNSGIARLNAAGFRVGAASTATALVDVGTDGDIVSGIIKLGTNPAAAGAVRMANNVGVYCRDQGNTTDIRIADVDTSNKINFGATNRTSVSHGGLEVMTRVVNANLTVDTTTRDQTVHVDTSGGARTMTLPTPTVGRKLTFKRYAGSNAVIIDPGSNFIEETSDFLHLVTDGGGSGVHPYVTLEGRDSTHWGITAHHSVQFVE
jgi:hypothetical protein